MAEIDIFRRSGLLELGAFEAGGILAGFAFRHFAIEQESETFLEAKVADVGLLALRHQSARHAGQAQLLQVVDGWMVKQGHVLSGQW